jgi:hypothetical protein
MLAARVEPKNGTYVPNRYSIFAAPHRRRHVRYQSGSPFTPQSAYCDMRLVRCWLCRLGEVSGAVHQMFKVLMNRRRKPLILILDSLPAQGESGEGLRRIDIWKTGAASPAGLYQPSNCLTDHSVRHVKLNALRVSDFRKRHLKALGDLFKQILQLCEKAGYKLGHVALDGTKIKANAEPVQIILDGKGEDGGIG